MRRLNSAELQQLEAQMCHAEDWNQVLVAEDFRPDYVHHVHFSGEVRLGTFNDTFTLPGGVKKHAGISHVTLHNVTVGDDCCIEHVENYIANYEIGHHTRIEHVDLLLVDGVSRFGNGVEVAVLNETGGREGSMNDKLSAHQAYIMALYRTAQS